MENMHISKFEKLIAWMGKNILLCTLHITISKIKIEINYLEIMILLVKKKLKSHIVINYVQIVTVKEERVHCFLCLLMSYKSRCQNKDCKKMYSIS